MLFKWGKTSVAGNGKINLSKALIVLLYLEIISERETEEKNIGK